MLTCCPQSSECCPASVGIRVRFPPDSAFKHGAETIAALYDLKADPAQRELHSFEEGGERYSLYWLRCRTREDLARRMRCCRAIADATFGLIGRSPDHVASLVTGLAMKPSVLDDLHKGYGQNLLRYYELARSNDIYLSYAVTPPSGLRSTQIYPGQQRDDPSLRVVREDDDGVVVSGMKMLATGAVYADEVWVGNLAPLDDKRLAESITCAVPLNAPGLSLWARQPYALHAAQPSDYPLSYRFDETDSVLVCDGVKVPWERVFLHNNGTMSRTIYLDTPANCYANHQSNIRFWAKMGSAGRGLPAAPASPTASTTFFGCPLRRSAAWRRSRRPSARWCTGR